jgi:hypothetical protein
MEIELSPLCDLSVALSSAEAFKEYEDKYFLAQFQFLRISYSLKASAEERVSVT